jgi:F-type H+-transporting ATPase subunit b
MKTLLRLCVLGLVFSCLAALDRAVAQSQEPSSAQSRTSSEPNKAKHEPPSIGQELAKEEREATGEAEEEEHAELKHSPMVHRLAKLTGGNVHRAHMLALGLNFVIIVFIVYWFGRKFVPGIFRGRTASIQHALEEARAASQDANRRLTEIENRLRQLDVEIGRMQASAEKEADAEEGRIKSAAEDDIRKVVEAAEQDIAAAAKLARRELTAHTADLAIALARKQISVDSNTDQVLVRTFASKLAPGGKDGN